MSDRLVAHPDALFPQDKVLLFYRGPGILDAALIFSPYRLEFHEDRFVFRSYQSVVNPAAVAVIDVDDRP
jgi:hypothetical protein